jgi:peptidoglycan-associated lipoprotein
VTQAPYATSPNSASSPGSEGGLLANIGDRVFFPSGSVALGPESRTPLDRIVVWLAKNKQIDVQIAGNTDEREVGTKQTEEASIALGTRRARTVADYMIAKGAFKTRIVMISYGRDRPIAAGSNQAARAQNRNATISVR